MKMFRLAALAILFLSVLPASAQWQTPNHSVPIGRGPGVTGFGSAAPAAAGRPFISNGAVADPSFGLITNGGITPGAANTLKGSLDGTSIADIAVPACTSVGSALQWAAGTGPQCNAVSVFTGFDTPVNMGLSSSAVGNALTITLTTASGATPSVASPVLVPFRSVTAATGTVTWRTITSTRTMTIPSGATMGASSSSVPFRLWLFLEDNGGTPELAVAMCSNSTSIFPCASWENTLKTSILLDTASDNAGVLYAPTAVAADAVRIIGFCDFSGGLATAGTWASSCTTLQLMGPGIKKPGDVVQTVYLADGALNTGTTALPFDDTIPQNTEGTQFMSQAITPTAMMNLLRVEHKGTYGNSGSAVSMSIALFQDSTANALVAGSQSASGANDVYEFVLRWNGLALTTSATTFKVRVGDTAGNTTTFNGTASARRFGGVSGSFLSIQEIMGALPEPANDNVHPGVFSKAA